MSLFILFFLVIQVAAIQAEVTKQQHDNEEDLAKAEPALQAANAALNTLNRVKHTFKYKDLNPFTTVVLLCSIQFILYVPITNFANKQRKKT